MALFMRKDIRIKCPFKAQEAPHQELEKILSIMQNPSIKSINFESNKILEFKININLYIPLQTMFPTRGYL
jgi:hypothetical protein